jgi:DNA-binding NarL/FixJ family response regulator
MVGCLELPKTGALKNRGRKAFGIASKEILVARAADNNALRCNKRFSTMAVKQRESETLGVLTIGFSPVVREGLQAILTKDERIEVVGDTPDGHEALMHIKRARDQGRPVKVVLTTETRNDKVDGVQATRLIKDEFPEVAVLVLAENLSVSYVIDAIQAGGGDTSSSRTYHRNCCCRVSIVWSRAACR